MADGDYIVLNRKILQWEWYKNENTKAVFLHCLLSANWKDGRFEGLEIRRGSFVSSYTRLAEQLGLSVMQVRTAVKHLKSTGEITVQPCHDFSVITINNYDSYQLDNRQLNTQITSQQQASNKPVTTIEKGNKGIREKGNNEKKEEENPLKEKVIEKETPKENMEQMYQRVSVEYELSEPLYDKLGEWFKYKQERRQTYKERGMRSLLKQAVDCSHQYGDIEVCNLIDFSMQSNYQGIFWERLTHNSKKSLAERWRDA